MANKNRISFQIFTKCSYDNFPPFKLIMGPIKYTLIYVLYTLNTTQTHNKINHCFISVITQNKDDDDDDGDNDNSDNNDNHNNDNDRKNLTKYAMPKQNTLFMHFSPCLASIAATESSP